MQEVPVSSCPQKICIEFRGRKSSPNLHKASGVRDFAPHAWGRNKWEKLFVDKLWESSGSLKVGKFVGNIWKEGFCGQDVMVWKNLESIGKKLGK